MKLINVIKKHSILLVLLIFVITFTYSHFNISHAELPDRCKGKEWTDPYAELECEFPSPPIGRWKAVYTKEFAEAHNLPAENISTDFSPGVDYMEMDVQPYGSRGSVACLVNMLVKKPNDVAFYNRGNMNSKWAEELNSKRRLMHLIDFEIKKNAIKEITTIYFASRDYVTEKNGFDGSTFSFGIDEILPSYDYLSANYPCIEISTHQKYFPRGYAFWIDKASVWGKYESLYDSIDDIGRPKGQAFNDSHFFINIPQELVLSIYKDVPIGGK